MIHLIYLNKGLLHYFSVTFLYDTMCQYLRKKKRYKSCHNIYFISFSISIISSACGTVTCDELVVLS